MPIPTVSPEAVAAAKAQLDQHLLEIIEWHFNPATGCQFWLDWARKNWDPRKEIRSFEDMLKFPHFQDESLRDLQPEVWVPAEFKGKPFNKKWSGWEARIFQHEYDHLDGTLYVDRLSPSERQAVQPALDRLVAQHGPGGVL